jgi:hypothetical protein
MMPSLRKLPSPPVAPQHRATGWGLEPRCNVLALNRISDSASADLLRKSAGGQAVWRQICGLIDVASAARERVRMESQAAGTVLLVRPAAFGFNAEAAESNVFSHASSDPDFERRAAAEFESVAARLSDAGVDVVILDDTRDPAKPDAVFPNNWFSTHADGTLVLYPMATAPRRLERRVDELRALLAGNGFGISRIVDLTNHEQQGRYLEGTGSLVLDRPRRRAYANFSSRTHPDVIADFDRDLGYSSFLFEARDPGGRPIYHTNVLLSLGTKFAVLCREAVAPDHRDALVGDIEGSGRTIVELTFAQLRRFGCNLLELRGQKGPLIALSQKALSNLQREQLLALESFGNLVAVDIPTIEAVGGGSIRCMIAEIHLPHG